MIILKATRDEKAYNSFMRAYNEMMRGRGGLFDSVPDAERGQDPYAEQSQEWRYLEDLGIHYNPATGEAFEEKYLEDEDEYEQNQIDIPTPVGAGLEGKVFRIPGTGHVVKIPMQEQSDDIRITGRERPPDRVMRSPLEAWWSNVLSHQYPINPYSVFSSKHPMGGRGLNIVSQFVDEYHPKYSHNSENTMNAIHEHLFNMKDVMPQWEDFAYEGGGELSDMTPEEIRELAVEHPLYGEDETLGNMYGNIAIDYMSDTPFIEDEYGGMLRQEEIDKLLEAALIEQERMPKRYRKFGGNIDSRVQTIIDELMESQKQGRLIGSSINFDEDRENVESSNFGRV